MCTVDGFDYEEDDQMEFARATTPEATPPREDDAFRRLVESELPPDEYVTVIERRVSEQRENGEAKPSPEDQQTPD